MVWERAYSLEKIATKDRDINNHLQSVLAALQEVHFIVWVKDYYHLTWAGRLLIDGLILLGWCM
jgi:hypothetical protein